MEAVIVTLTGTCPLLMHNEQLANPFNHYAKEMKKITSKRKKTEDDYLALSYQEFKGGLYYNEDHSLGEIGPYIPDHWLIAHLRDAGRLTKRGKDILRAVRIITHVHPIRYEGPRTMDDLWKGNFVDRRMVGNQKNRILRTRPKFERWGIRFELNYDETVFELGQIREILGAGGDYIGLGDYRPRFGRFTVEVS